MSAVPTTSAATIAAGGISAGGAGFLIVVVLIVLSVGLFMAMSGSLKRMRGNVDSGEFRDEADAEAGPADRTD